MKYDQKKLWPEMKQKPKTITCSCGREFTAHYDYCTNILKSKKCPSCQFKKAFVFVDKVKVVKKNGKDSPKSKAMKLADDWFSRYIRIKYHSYIDLLGNVYCKCIVSGNQFAANRMDCGHGFSRGNKATRYDEDNCRPQNRSSNRFKGEAHHYIFLDHLKQEIGEERFTEIERKQNDFAPDNEMYYKEISDKYRILTNKLVKELGIKKWW